MPASTEGEVLDEFVMSFDFGRSFVDRSPQGIVRISAIVDDCFSLIVDGISTPSWTRGDTRKRGVKWNGTYFVSHA